MVAAYERSPTMKSLMSIALTRYAARETEPTQATILSAAEVAASTGGPRTDDVLVMNTGLAAAFDDHCSHCHDEGQYFYVDGWTFDKAQPALPRPLAVRMLTQLAYGTMPKQGMGLVERKALIERFIDALWTDEADRREARSLFLDYWDRPAAHSLSAIFGRQAHSAGLSETDTLGTRAAFAVEPYLDQDSARLNPGLLGLSALDALALCRKKHGDDAKARNQCVEELVQLPLLIKGGLEGGQR